MSLKKLTTYEIISLIISGLGLVSIILLIIQTRAMTTQTKQLSDSLESAALTNISSQEFEINKIFFEHPELRPYFFDGKDIDETNKDYARVFALASLRHDFIATFFYQSKYIPEFQSENNQTWQLWDRYIKDIYAKSPVMCKHLERAADYDSPAFIEFGRQSCSQGR